MTVMEVAEITYRRLIELRYERGIMDVDLEMRV
jgi:hypothetical protein